MSDQSEPTPENGIHASALSGVGKSPISAEPTYVVVATAPCMWAHPKQANEIDRIWTPVDPKEGSP